MKVSIIISLYNLENYISQCLDSLINQIFDDYEIIIVNDGSTDNSEDICKNYLSYGKNVKYFHKTNGGASSARNFGLQNCSGDYIIFMDGDDYWDNANALELINSKIENKPDIIIFGCKDFDEKTGELSVSRNSYDIDFLEKADKALVIKNLVEEKKLPGAAWIVCSNRQFLLDHNIVFEEGIKAEDIDWVYSVLHFSKTISFLNAPFYVYRKNRKNSATFSFDDKSLSGILYTIQKWMPKIAKNPDLKYLFYNLNFHFLLTVIFAKSFNENQLSIMNNHKDILNYALTLRDKAFSFMIKILGIKNSNKLFSHVRRS